VRGPKFVHPARVHARGVVPQPAPRRKRAQPVDELPSIDSTWLDGVTGGRIVPSGSADPRIVAGLKGLTDAITAAGKSLADKSSASLSQTLELFSRMKEKMGGGDKKK